MAVDITIFEEITDFIESSKFSKAEIKLKYIIDKKENYSDEDYYYACFLRGYIHVDYKYKDKKENIARKMLLNNIESDYPIPMAYCLYADVLKDKNTSTNYLQSGLKTFPNNASIYMSLLKYCSKDEVEMFANEIKEKGIKDTLLTCKIIQSLWNEANWKEVEYFLNELVVMASPDNKSHLFYKLLYTFSLIAQKKEVEHCSTILLEIITKDLFNFLNYMPYIGYIWCCIMTHNIDEAIIFINKIPDTNVLQDFNEGPWWDINVDMSNVVKQIFTEIVSYLTDSEIILKIEILEALYLYHPSEIYDINRFTRKHLSALKKYRKKHVKNIELASAVFYMQKYFKQHLDAYKTFISMLKNYLDIDKIDSCSIDFLDQCSHGDFSQIYENTLKIIKSHVDIDMKNFITDVFDVLINHIWATSDKIKYQKIVNLCEPLGDYDLKNSNCMFELAYSYAKLEKKSFQAEKIYNMLLKNDPQNSAVINNLGVILENRGDLNKALEYFEKAFNINCSDNIHINNYNRVSSKIKKYQSAILSLEKETSWLLGRLLLLCEASDDSGEFICTYKNRPSLLKVSPPKGDELFEKFLSQNYIFKVSSDGASKYEINPWVKSYIEMKQEHLNKNKRYEILGNKLNIDELHRIGYTDVITDAVNRIKDIPLRDILQRDVHECAVSVVAEQYKSAIVICGSIIEAILVYVIEKKGVNKYDIGTLVWGKAKTKSVKEMDLNELLELGKLEKIIDVEEYHLSNYVRAYRNIIHPSCEVRKSYNVDALTVNLMWNALLAVIREVL